MNVYSFCNDFGGSSTLLLNYAVLLLQKASSEIDDPSAMEANIQKALGSIEVGCDGLASCIYFLSFSELVVRLCSFKLSLNMASYSDLRDQERGMHGGAQESRLRVVSIQL